MNDDGEDKENIFLLSLEQQKRRKYDIDMY